MPRIVGGSSRVVDADGFVIDELAGNVATQDDRISIAHVTAKAGTSEPWLTLQYDEWICVLKGKIVLESVGNPSVEVNAGQTVLVEKGERFKPSFPEDSEYVPVCLPAFRPDRCIREDVTAEGTAISTKLRELHHLDGAEAPPNPPAAAAADAAALTCSAEAPPEVLYHMTTVAQWEAAKASGEAYYPPTFEADGHYTHATGVPSRLLTTANHFYQDVEGDWVCLTFTRSALRAAGIFVRDEEAMPVGDKPVGNNWSNWVCPHVIGGIPLGVVSAETPMTRDGPVFTGIPGLVGA